MSKYKTTIKVSAAIAVSLAAITAANGQFINATSFDFETHASNNSIIRNMGTKVGFIKNAPSLAPTYMSYPGMDLTGVTHVTVRASSGAATGGTLSLRLGRPAGTDLAAVNITPTGGWDNFQDFTVPVNASEIATIGGRGFPLHAVVTPGQTNYGYDLQSFKFEKTSVGQTIEAESFNRERYGSYADTITTLGTKVGYLKQDGNWMEYDNINFVGSAASITVKAASANPQGGTLVIYDGPAGANNVLGRVKINSTGSWDTFQEFSANITAIPSGVKTISFGFEGSSYVFDIDSFKFNLNPTNNLGLWINAATYDTESDSADENWIRDMVTKVGYIKAPGDITFNGFDAGNAQSVTIRYSSAGDGGSVIVYANGAGRSKFAKVDLAPTGDWNTIQEVTVNLEDRGVSTDSDLFLLFYSDVRSPNYLYDLHAIRFNP
jgi:hypothetical protein